jgi:hypothetical protein
VVPKVEAACHRNLRAILVPSGNRAALEASTSIPAPVLAESVRYVATIDEAIDAALAADEMD